MPRVNGNSLLVVPESDLTWFAHFTHFHHYPAMSRKLPLTPLNSHVVLGKPDEGPVLSASESPSLILLFGYMDARPAHLQKYVDGLHTEFPTATLVLIKSFSNFFWSTNDSLESVLMPVVDVLKSHATLNDSGILVHILSNGGGFNYMTFHRLLEKLAIQGSLKATPSALILDSTPGDGGLDSSIRFAAPSSPIFRLLAIPPISLLYGIFYAINTIRGNTPIFDQLRATLFSPDVLPTILDSKGGVKATPRMYVYSKVDKIADPAKIKAHIEEAERKGFDVRVEIYETTSHVGHARKDPERYWGAVRALWKDVATKPLMSSL
ncbi:hypothetical protein DFH08DRAFT_907998 [Mycena albidolilacea]|uniref:Indole-diterpene biosynthesis protein PaxU n=1 Tax=Mycena albidolilacea TaxID=1033008 RepID=A0AAD6YWQ5_9AGAR|nr:hypothetical protein DFH08DRAFT_907998 [Mycena albidolilacea]